MNCIVAHSAVGVQLHNMRYHTEKKQNNPPPQLQSKNITNERLTIKQKKLK